MYILTLRCDQPTAYLGLLRDNQLVDSLDWLADRSLATSLNQKIADLLKKNNLVPKDLGGLVFFKGPGSFTGLRIGASVFNTMAYSLRISIVGTTGENWQSEGVDSLLSGTNENTVIPFYGSEAHITPAKK